jgi:NADH:ubiquinone oxidoreductase subunit F (NADH-binding)
METATAARLEYPPPPTGVPRLLAGARAHGGRMGFREHARWYGDPCAGLGAGGLIHEVDEAGLRGRGGGAFPTAQKLAAVASARPRPIVVVNGVEGEPASWKDRHLLAVAPHLVLDGAELAATELGASRLIVAVRRDAVDAVRSLSRALAERGEGCFGLDPVEVALAPPRYVGGEETALVHWLDGGPIRPLDVPPRPYERGVSGKPTLVVNVETAAHLALIARYGAGWFRSVGPDHAPGTALMTLAGAVGRRGVAEVGLGASLEAIVLASEPHSDPAMLLIGGCFGGWLPWSAAAALACDPESLRLAGAGLGAGILVVAPDQTCVLEETARIAAYLASEGAGQCGPCTYGVRAVAGDLRALCSPQASGLVTDRLRRRLAVVDGRGACRLPDGLVRLVSSALVSFPDHVAAHEHGHLCRESSVVPLPSLRALSEADWR